jgi:lysophospholipase L1-like esterase
VLPPGDPYRGYIPHQVHIHQSQGWKVDATLGPGASHAPGAEFGISGYRLTATSPGASFSLTADPVAAFSQLTVCAVAGSGGGGYSATLGGVRTTVSLGSEEGPDCRTFRSAGRETEASVQAEAAPVTILSWATFATGGVTVSNLGMVGAQLRHWAVADDLAVRRELQAYAPDLIVIEFGTNEGFSGRLDAGGYEAGLRAVISRLRRLAPMTPVLVLGAPDAGTNRPELRHNAGGLGEDVSVKATRDGSYPPPALAAVREIQKRVALGAGAAFWDWASAMGGPGTASAWVAAEPAMMRPDHVHYTAPGSAEIARRLQNDLDRATTLADYGS